MLVTPFWAYIPVFVSLLELDSDILILFTDPLICSIRRQPELTAKLHRNTVASAKKIAGEFGKG